MEKFVGTSAYLEGTKVVINEEKPHNMRKFARF